MLSTIGKIAAVVTMLGGAALFHPNTARAMAPSACSEYETYETACWGGDGNICDFGDGNGPSCFHVDGCIHVESPNGDYLQWVTSCVYNGGDPCPGSVICG